MRITRLDSINSESDIVDMRTMFSENIAGKRKFRFGWASFPPGSRVPKEGTTVHEGDEYSLITKGKATMSVNGVAREIAKGDISFIAAGEGHFTLNDSLDNLEVVWVLLE